MVKCMYFRRLPVKLTLFSFLENFLIGLERKYLEPIIIFLFSPPNQILS